MAFKRSVGFVCDMCSVTAPRRAVSRKYSVLARRDRPTTRRQQSHYVQPYNDTKPRRRYQSTVAVLPTASKLDETDVVRRKIISVAGNPNAYLQSLIEEGNQIISAKTVPQELEILEFLERCHNLANYIVFGSPEAPPSAAEDANRNENDTPTNSLLDLDETPSRSFASSPPKDLPISFRVKASEKLCVLIYDVLCDSKIFIKADMLDLYVRVQALLGKPEYLPNVFDLYATKPIPKHGSKPITYAKAWAPSPKNAIPRKLSDAALDAAIAKKNLPLALAIIDTTVATSAFKFNKILSRATLPFVATAAVPISAYAIASWASLLQNVWDEDMARWMLMAGILTYTGTLGTVGFVALTTSNDQMERVVWQPGTRLRDRWIREEERLYLDRVAMAWGFKERWRRGEEQGEEWEALREHVALRSMVLDKTELLDGME